MNKEFDVYVTYAPEDRPRVGRLVEELEAVGLKVWWLDQPHNARESVDMLKHRLTGDRAHLVVWSKDAAASGRVQAEARVGSESGRLVAARFETVMPPRGTQANVYAELTDWNGGSSHRGIQKLHGGIYKLTGKGMQVSEPPPIPNYVPSPDSPVAHLSEAERDQRAWDITQRYNNQTYYEYYLEHYPNGRYAEEARQRLNKKRRNWRTVLGVVIGFMVLYFIVYWVIVLGSL